MSVTNLSVADEVEAALAAFSPEKCVETAERVTALFLASAGGYSDEQIELLGDVFERLVNTIELRAIADMSARIALAELSSQLAPVPQAPANVIRHLAGNEDISIAGPVLKESPRLTEDDLVGLARVKGEKHLLAIAGRWWLQEVVTGTLVARCFPSVSRRVVDNPGARVSAASFTLLVAQAASDPELAVATGIRADLPAELRTQLLRGATEAVKAKLLASAPPYLFDEIRAAISAASSGVNHELWRERDFRTAQATVARLKKEGRLDAATLLGFARQKRYEETVAALAELSKSSIEIVRPLTQSLRSDGILVPCKVAGLDWETVRAVLDCRFSTGITADTEANHLRRQYTALSTEKAHRLLNLWKVRVAAPPSKRH